MSKTKEIDYKSELFILTVELFEGDRDKAEKWFRSPNRGLGGVSPLLYSNKENGEQEVRDLIGRLEYGMY